MKNNALTALRFALTGALGCWLLLAPEMRAQEAPPETDRPTNSAASTEPDEELTRGYTVTSTIEAGVRGLAVDGSLNKFRSDLNYKPGFRLFDSSFLMQSKESRGKAFDTLLVVSSGWSADPTGHTLVKAEKTGLYRFDANVRRFTYFNNLTNHALNQHTANTRHKVGDFDLTLLPENESLKVRVGYGVDRNSGPGLNTFRFTNDEFPIVSDVQSRANDFRVGVDAKVLGFDVALTQGYRHFRNDTNYSIQTPQPGNNPSPNISLATFQRQLPITGQTFNTQFTLHRLFMQRLDFTGRFIYSSATSRFKLSETLTGRDAAGNTIVLDQFDANGSAKRPNVIGDVGITFQATKKLRISETFSANSFRDNGASVLAEALFRQSPAGLTLPTTFVNTRGTGLINHRRFINTIEADYQFNRRYSLHAGYRYTDRHIVLRDFERNLAQNGPVEMEFDEFDSRTNTFLFGFKAQPLSMWTVYFDLERGAADNVFTRQNSHDFTNIRVRNRVTPSKTLTLNFSVITKDRSNPSPLQDPGANDLGADVNHRTYTSSIDWVPDARLSLSGGYTYQHLTSDVAIFVPLNNMRLEGNSQYFLRDSYAFLDGFMSLHPRATLFASYRISKDTGQGDRVSPAPNLIIGSYPLQFQSPEARFAFKLHSRVDWNVGYQFYDYKESFQSNQNYRGHLPYTSLRIYIGRRE